jgi:hypothetical protein
MKLKTILAGLALAFMLAAPTVQAAEFVSPVKDGSGVIDITSGTPKNLYVVGADVSISVPVLGDLFSAAGKLSIKGNVEQDVALAAGTIILDGAVGGDVRSAGGDITINGTVGGDVLIGSGTLRINDTARIGGDVVIGSGVLILNAPVAGNVKIGGGEITINNTIAGKVNIQADTSLTFGPKAVVAQKVSYRGKSEAVVQEGAQVSNIEFNKIEGGQKRGMNNFARLFGISFVIKLIGLFIAAWLLVHFMPRRSKSVVEGVSSEPWANLGIGFVSLIVFPIAIILCLVTVIGYYIAFIALAWFILTLMLTWLLTAIVVGAYIDKWLMKRQEIKLDWQAVAMGSVALMLACLIPVIGWVAVMVIMLMTFGSTLRLVKTDIKTHQ